MIAEFLGKLRKQGSRLWVENENLKFRVFRDAPFSESDLDYLKANKSTIIEWLQARPTFFEARPLSENQRAMWLLYQLDMNSCAYNLSVAISLSPHLDIQSLKEAVSDLFQHHDILRTAYFDEEGESLQCIKPFDSTFELPFKTSTVSGYSQQAIQNLVAKEADVPFDLELGQVCRACLLQNEHHDRTDNIFQLSIHHIAADFWSCEVIIDELLERYKYLSGGQMQDFPTPQRQPESQQSYFDWTVQQYCLLQQEAAQEARSFWREVLFQKCENQLSETQTQSGTGKPTDGSLLQGPELITDFPRPAVQRFSGEVIRFPFTKDLDYAIRSLAKSLDVTPFVICLSAYQVLLYRYSANEKFVIGMPTSGRLQQASQRTVGYLVNPVAVPCDCAGAPNFVTLVHRVKDMTQAVLAHQTFPFNKVIEELNIPRDTSRNPVFQHLFAMTHVHQKNHLDLVQHTWLSEQRGAPVDLSLAVLDDRIGFTGEWRYNQDLFTHETAQTMVSVYLEILERVVKEPDIGINQISLISAKQEQHMLAGWNATGADFPQDACLHSLFEQQVAQTPDAIAVVFGNNSLTYQQLNDKANQLARYLMTQFEIKPDDLIGICVDHSVDMVTGILAILKTGGAYVPLDPDYPKSRLEYMQTDADLRLVLVQQDFVELFVHNKIPTVVLDSPDVEEVLSRLAPGNIDSLEPGSLEIEDLENHPKVTANHLAYVIYTSGSTGQPKGVMVEHRNVIRLVKNSNYLDFTEPQVIAQVSNMSFDAMTFELWGSLLNGGKLVHIPKAMLMDFAHLQRTLTDAGITTMFVTTALFNTISQTSPDALLGLKNVLFGGEDCSIDAIKKVMTAGKPERLLHVYGPTESTTFAVWKSLEESYIDTTQKVALGKPLSNTTAYVLDQHCQPVPSGMIGELYLGAEGLARGYLNRDELTQQRFIPLPTRLKEYCEDNHHRLYRTGDLVRWSSDGDLIYVGRADDQVKIRGFRIEIGEIEKHLLSLPEVAQALVRVVEKGDSGKKLVAYIIPTMSVTSESAQGQSLKIKPQLEEQSKDGTSKAWCELVDFIYHKLNQLLPRYMQPDVYVVLNKIPVTHNGKVDYKALPEPDMSSLEANYVPPASDTEIALCQMCQSLLGIEKVGVNNNFFELGGNSLLAARLIAQVKAQFLVQLPLNQFFNISSISELAKVIDVQQPAMTESDFDRMDALLEELGA